MGIGGIETGVRDIAKYLNKKKIDNYILCESSNKNFNIKGLKIIKLDNLNCPMKRLSGLKSSIDPYFSKIISPSGISMLPPKIVTEVNTLT